MPVTRGIDIAHERAVAALLEADRAVLQRLKGTTMPAKPTIPSYTAKAYDFCDVLDELAGRPSGAFLADALAGRALGMAAKAYPRVAERVLGAGTTQALVAVYKAMDDTDLIDQARAALGPAAFRAALEQLIAAAKQPAVTKKAAAPVDPVAVAFQSDIRHIDWGGE